MPPLRCRWPDPPPTDPNRLVRHALRDSGSVADSGGGAEEDVARLRPARRFGRHTVVAADLDLAPDRGAVDGFWDRPTLAAAEQGTCRRAQRVLGLNRGQRLFAGAHLQRRRVDWQHMRQHGLAPDRRTAATVRISRDCRLALAIVHSPVYSALTRSARSGSRFSASPGQPPPPVRPAWPGRGWPGRSGPESGKGRSKSPQRRRGTGHGQEARRPQRPQRVHRRFAQQHEGSIAVGEADHPQKRRIMRVAMQTMPKVTTKATAPITWRLAPEPGFGIAA